MSDKDIKYTINSRRIAIGWLFEAHYRDIYDVATPTEDWWFLLD